MPIIALISDYGTSDWFVGELKASILSISPQSAIIDITHEIGHGDIARGAFTLLACYKRFPPGTIFCSVIDPDTSQPCMTIKTDHYVFIGPDNGVLCWALMHEKFVEIRRIEASPQGVDFSKSTFRGRDVLGPVAAHYAQGFPFEKTGPTAPLSVKLPWFGAKKTDSGLQGSIIHIDRFGNAITTIDEQSLSAIAAPKTISIAGTKIPFFAAYTSVSPGQAMGYVGSAGFVEIAVNNGHADQVFGLATGMLIDIA